MSLMSAKKLLVAGAKRVDVDKVFATTLSTVPSEGARIPTPFAPEFNWEKARNLTSAHVVSTSLMPGRLDTSSLNALINDQAYVDGVQSSYKAANGAGTKTVAWSLRRARRFFDILTYTGDGSLNRRISHRLSIRPGFILVKAIDGNDGNGWYVYHSSLGFRGFFYLNQPSVAGSGEGVMWGDSDANATDFGIGNNAGGTNVAGRRYIAYLFADDRSVSGIIRTGSYTGNGSTAGGSNVPVNVNIGWEPQWMLIKNVGSSADWFLIDNKRLYNGGTLNEPYFLSPNYQAQEGQGGPIHFVPTGLKIQHALPFYNAVSEYVYLAIRKGVL